MNESAAGSSWGQGRGGAKGGQGKGREGPIPFQEIQSSAYFSRHLPRIQWRSGGAASVL